MPATAAYGHFGRTEPNFTWERTDKAEVLRDAAGIKRGRSPRVNFVAAYCGEALLSEERCDRGLPARLGKNVS